MITLDGPRPASTRESEHPMSQPAKVRIDVADLVLARAPGGRPVRLGEITGVQVVVLLRHRH